MELRQAKDQEHIQVADLAVKIFKSNMKKQFIRLFHHDNLAHMMVAVDHEKVVASVNHYVTDVLSNRGCFKVASIGAVCTDKAYRKQGIASQLLHLTEAKMREEHVDFCIISGDLDIYLRFGARDVGYLKQYMITRSDQMNHIDIREFNNQFDEIYTIYQQEDIRYIRTKDEFIDLFKGQTYPDDDQSYPTYIIYHENKAKAYLVLEKHQSHQTLGIKEFAGDRHLIKDALQILLNKHHKDKIRLIAPTNDPICRLMTDKPKKITQQATLKIVDELAFITHLNESNQKENIPVWYTFNNKLYICHIEEESYILDHDAFHQLIFSGKIPKDWVLKHKKWMKQLVPIELPYSHNLNYQ
ncbi:MAG: GNAT family N-acetyltransferase [Acholeplasmataceae bacterium]|jgi:predicted acetyltransferase|nr:GNAT family N-acetyltransferase [Acholeplasmataceae bacterium]